MGNRTVTYLLHTYTEYTVGLRTSDDDLCLSLAVHQSSILSVEKSDVECQLLERVKQCLRTS